MQLVIVLYQDDLNSGWLSNLRAGWPTILYLTDLFDVTDLYVKR